MTSGIDSGCKTHLRGQENTFPVILPPLGHFRPSDSPLKISRFGRFWPKMRFCPKPQKSAGGGRTDDFRPEMSPRGPGDVFCTRNRYLNSIRSKIFFVENQSFFWIPHSTFFWNFWKVGCDSSFYFQRFSKKTLKIEARIPRSAKKKRSQFQLFLKICSFWQKTKWYF